MVIIAVISLIFVDDIMNPERFLFFRYKFSGDAGEKVIGPGYLL
jgi:hypothetical protein